MADLAGTTNGSRRLGRRMVAVLAATATATGLSVGLAAPAHAETVTVVDAAVLQVAGGPTIALEVFTNSPQTPVGGTTGPLRVVPEEATTGCEATDFAGQDYTGSIAVIRRGGCDFETKQSNAAGAGAIGVVITNNNGDPLTGKTAGTSVPIGGASTADGDTLTGFAGRVATLDLRYHTEERTPPTANADPYSTPQDTPLTVPAPGVLGNDTDPDANTTLTATGLDTTGTQGTVVLAADGGFTYTPPTGFSGSTTFTYRASDGTATSAPATVTITVTAAPPVPNRADLAATLTVPASARAGSTIPVTLTVRNTGPATATRVASGIALPDGMSVTGAGGGVVATNRRAVGFTAASIAPNASVTYSITVTVAPNARGAKAVGGGVISTRTQDPALGNNYQVRSTTVTR